MRVDRSGWGHRLSALFTLRPRSRRELHALVRGLFGIDVVHTVDRPGADAPLDYLAHAFFEPDPSLASRQVQPLSRDCVVWANRGGGKTLLGAVATLLDLVYKPGVEVRVLGGSLEQSSKMHDHLVRLLDRETLRGVLAAEPTARRVVLSNGSRVEVLAGSQRSVRGVRVHKLRCDEVEELDPAVWSAAQLTTRSGWCGDGWVQGAVEALSTMHRPGGLMAELAGADREQSEDREDQENETHSVGPRVFRWNALDVVAPCPPMLACDGCALWSDCEGRAKSGRGFLPVADLLQQRRRSSDVAWSAEMMCRRPGVQHAVFDGFDPAEHVTHAPVQKADGEPWSWVAGMDFGLRCPTVMLWAMAVGRGRDARVRVMAEYDAENRTLEQNLTAIEALRKRRDLPTPAQLAWLAIDPAGNARNSHSGRSDAAVLRQHGYRVRSFASRIEDGIEVIRRRLDHGTLTIDPSCKRLTDAMMGYHFDALRPFSTQPVKDGPDHWCDALRYLVNALERDVPVRRGQYL